LEALVSAYYNEFDPKAAAWLRQLIKNGMIADGEVDERSITEVTADEIRGFTQHHFFAGIGGWPHSLRLAGWEDSRPVCTASLPCQPFSVAGAQKGVDDERHLLPHFIELVKQCNFQTIFGEQVPGAIKHGWLDDLCLEMEREKYAVGSIVLTAAGAGAPHIRQRLYWVADSSTEGLQRHRRFEQKSISEGWEGAERYDSASGCDDGMGNTELHGHDANKIGRSFSESETEGRMFKSEGPDTVKRLGNTEYDGQPASSESRSNATSIQHSQTRENSTSESEGTSTSRIVSEWTDPDWLYCRDEKYRPIKSSIEPLANGLPRGMGYSSDPSEPIEPNNTQEARVMRLKGYGNAIVPQVASQFISAFMSTQ